MNMMKAVEKTILFILQIIELSTAHVNSKPCSKSNSECMPVRMPLMSNDLKSPLIAELDISSVNEHLKSYINADINSTFSEEVKDMVKNEQEQTKTSIESESTFNTEIKDSLNGYEHRQESLKLAMMSEYLSKLQQSQDVNNRKFKDLASDLKSHFATLSQEFKEEFKKSTTDLQSERQEFEEWKTNLMETLNVRNLGAKQREITLAISDVYKNLSESESTFNTEIKDSLNGYEHRQESLKLAMMSEYLSKLQQSQDVNNRKFKDLASDLKSHFATLSQEFKEEFKKSTTDLQSERQEFEEWKTNLMETLNDLASDLKSHFATLSQEFKEEFKKSTTDLQSERQEFEEWKTNLMETLNETFAPLNKYKDCSYMRGTGTTPSGVLQRRIDRTTSFDKNWIDYKEGFGDLQKEYWLGNKYLNILTSKDKYELRVDLSERNNKKTYPLFKTFIVGDENSKYKLTIGDYSGNAGNYMAHNNGRAFSTNDRENDDNNIHCAVRYGAWWHGAYSNSWLNGKDNKNYYWAGYKYNTTKMMLGKIL
ncbi:unnamed protein product [Mytilus coruscus]|uniref:Fibrinogen C-terminal domain-containing protein n=1 Tax=Mytilus coruscus TaxID=42192 RepID=A0A6J8F2D0_MYTCO|nr:unnamed protein product [Mytilus coruscus]